MLPIGWGNLLSRHNQSEVLPRSRRVTRHQSAVIFQTSFLVTRRNMQHSSMFVLRIWAQQIHRTDLSGAWEREEKEVPTKSYWRGNGIVYPPEFGTHELFLSNLADKPSRKNGESYASAISWLRTRRSFEILRSVHTCVRGSRTFFHKNSNFLDDFSVIKCKRCGHF